MKNIFESSFAPYITGLVEQKRVDGFSYASGEYLLKRFDTFCKESHPKTDIITYELATEWSTLKPTESKNYRNTRMAALRQLSLYMLSLGIDTYVPRNYSWEPKPVLYIPTQDEIASLLKEMGTWKSPQKKHQRFIDECKMMCLLYYCCGMRVSEARLLKKEHVDLGNGILTIYASKGHKDRLVYLPRDGIGVFSEYLRNIQNVISDSPWVFPGEDPSKPITSVAVESRFKKCWSKLPFSANANKRPTPHCLRHAFVVDRLNDWMLQGIDTHQMFAYLSKHLGHKSPSETFYYYHLVSKAFAMVKEKDKMSNRVIPEVVAYEDI